MVMNINLFGILGAGYIQMGSTGVPALNLGAGQNFFLTKNFGIRFDLRFLIFQGPDATSQCLSDKSGQCSSTATPPASAFSDRMFFNSQLGAAAMFIL